MRLAILSSAATATAAALHPSSHAAPLSPHRVALDATDDGPKQYAAPPLVLNDDDDDRRRRQRRRRHAAVHNDEQDDEYEEDERMTNTIDEDRRSHRAWDRNSIRVDYAGRRELFSIPPKKSFSFTLDGTTT